MAFPFKNSVLLTTAMLMCLRSSFAFRQQAQITTDTNRPATITEPAKIKLSRLFEVADTVAIVRVLSGDTESYKTAVYKAQVVESFKGTKAGDILYFGPYIGTSLGSEYIVFLRSTKDLVEPRSGTSLNYGPVQYSEVFNEGYSSMITSYECVFNGKDVAQQCDYGVRVCTDYIVLPDKTPTFLPEKADTPFGCRWVRKTAFTSLLQQFSRTVASTR